MSQPSDKPEKITVKEVEDRLKATLAGAFAGAPTQLKSIRKTKPKITDQSDRCVHCGGPLIPGQYNEEVGICFTCIEERG